MSSCTQDTTLNQKVVVKGNSNLVQNLQLLATVNSGLKCWSSSVNQVKLAQQLAANATAKANTESSPFILGFSFNASLVDQTTVQRAFERQMVTNINKCKKSFNIDQDFNIDGNYNQIIDSSLSLAVNDGLSCVFSNSNMLEVSQSVASTINAEASAKVSGINAIIIVIIIIIILVIVGVVIIAVWRYYANKGINIFDRCKDIADTPAKKECLTIKKKREAMEKKSKKGESSEGESKEETTEKEDLFRGKKIE